VSESCKAQWGEHLPGKQAGAGTAERAARQPRGARSVGAPLLCSAEGGARVSGLARGLRADRARDRAQRGRLPLGGPGGAAGAGGVHGPGLRAELRAAAPAAGREHVRAPSAPGTGGIRAWEGAVCSAAPAAPAAPPAPPHSAPGTCGIGAWEVAVCSAAPGAPAVPPACVAKLGLCVEPHAGGRLLAGPARGAEAAHAYPEGPVWRLGEVLGTAEACRSRTRPACSHAVHSRAYVVAMGSCCAARTPRVLTVRPCMCAQGGGGRGLGKAAAALAAEVRWPRRHRGGRRTKAA